MEVIKGLNVSFNILKNFETKFFNFLDPRRIIFK